MGFLVESPVKHENCLLRQLVLRTFKLDRTTEAQKEKREQKHKDQKHKAKTHEEDQIHKETRFHQ